MTEHTDQPTLDHYQASVPYYTLAFDRSHSRFLDGFLDRLPAGTNVLELGCGTGRDAARMIERGFAVDATDGTPAMVAKANERHNVKARLMRFEDCDATEEYGAVWAHACLMHAPRAALPALINSIHRALVKGGLHFASFKRGDDEFRDDRGRLNSRLSPPYVEQMYRAAGFEILELVPWQGKGADGVLRDWIAVTVRK